MVTPLASVSSDSAVEVVVVVMVAVVVVDGVDGGVALVDVAGTTVPTAAVPATLPAQPVRHRIANNAVTHLTGVRMADLRGSDQLSATRRCLVKIIRAGGHPGGSRS